MKNTITGTIKFIHPNGYGFVTTDDGDVFIHVEGFLQPTVVETCKAPMVTYPKAEIDPKDIKKGMVVNMEIKEGPKGKAAKFWCFDKGHRLAKWVVKTTPVYRLLARRIVSGEIYGDPINHCWVTDQWLSSDWVWEGYDYQLDQYRREPGVEYQMHRKIGEDSQPCECPLGLYNGGPLFDLPVDWKRSVKNQ